MGIPTSSLSCGPWLKGALREAREGFASAVPGAGETLKRFPDLLLKLRRHGQTPGVTSYLTANEAAAPKLAEFHGESPLAWLRSMGCN